jgi:uncharacterized Tic20 family protein
MAMQERDPAREQGTHPAGTAKAIDAQDERLWSILAHVSVLIAPIGALIIWLVYKDRSERVRFHALQALWYQVAWIGIFVAYFLVATILSILTLGIAAVILFPLMMVLPIAPLIHGCYAAYRVSQGEDYRYPFVADRIDGGIRRVA